MVHLVPEVHDFSTRSAQILLPLRRVFAPLALPAAPDLDVAVIVHAFPCHGIPPCVFLDVLRRLQKQVYHLPAFPFFSVIDTLSYPAKMY